MRQILSYAWMPFELLFALLLFALLNCKPVREVGDETERTDYWTNREERF